jgi:hypothetical protein
MEPTTGIEPVNLFLTKEALYLLSYVGMNLSTEISQEQNQANKNKLERETRLELATISLEG